MGLKSVFDSFDRKDAKQELDKIYARALQNEGDPSIEDRARAHRLTQDLYLPESPSELPRSVGGLVKAYHAVKRAAFLERNGVEADVEGAEKNLREQRQKLRDARLGSKARGYDR